MTLDILRDFFGWSAALNYIVLLVWYGTYTIGHHWLYTLHSRWFSLTETQFDAIQYGGMGLYKVFWLVFNLVPFLVLLAMT